MSAVSSTEPSGPRFPLRLVGPSQLPGVLAARAEYDRREAEEWALYATDPSYLAGRGYIAAEAVARKACEVRVQRARYRRNDDEKSI